MLAATLRPRVLLVLKKSQSELFERPVQVSGGVDKHGHYRKPHTRMMRVKRELPAAGEQRALFDDAPAAPARRAKASRLDAFLRKHGGIERLAAILQGLTDEQRARIVSEMAKLGGQDAAGIEAMLSGAKPQAQHRDLFSDAGEAPAPAPAPAKRAPERKPAAAKAPAPAPAPEPEPEPTPAPASARTPATAADPLEFGVPAGITKAARRTLNAQARTLLQSGGPYSAADLAVLRQYSGNGGVGDSLNEYYTRPDVALAMWSVAQDLGLADGAQVLEPSCGTGVYLHTAPAGVKVTGVELDSVSAGIAQVLHGEQHETVNASLERFATQDARQFDAVIGNVPFGLRGGLVKDDKPQWKTAEAYFCDAAMDKTRGGGLVGLIVPTGIMDGKNNRKLRETLMRKGQFLGAQRMPNTAFEHSHTGVTTDIVWLRKYPDDVAGALASDAIKHSHLKELGVWDEEFLAGSYFTGRGAGNIHGTMEDGWRAKAGMGVDITVSGSMEGVAESLQGFKPDPVASAAPTLQAVLATVAADEKAHAKALGAAMNRPYENKAKVGDTKTIDGVTYVLQGKPPRWHRVDEVVASPAMSSAVELSARIDALLRDPSGEGREALARDVQAWVQENGLPSKHKDLLLAARADKTLYRLIGAVGGSGALSDALTGRAAQAVKGDFETTVQSLLTGRAAVSVDAIAQRLDISEEEALDHLYGSARYALDATTGEWTTRDIYLSGDLWAKLDAAREALQGTDLDESTRAKLQAQEKLLDEAIAPVSLEDVFIETNSAFIPTDVLSAFMTWRNREGPDANEWTQKLPPVVITFADGVYQIEGGNGYGVQKYLDQYLNRTGLRKDDKPSIDKLNEEFKEWLCQSEFREEVESLYNRRFRGFAPREFSNEPMDIAGMNTEGLKDFQYGGLRWALNAGKGIIAHDVGLGKTVLALMLARTMKTTGQAKRPLIVVPKSVLANWYAECEKWFPGSNVLTIGGTFERGKDGELRGKDDDAAERRRKYHDLQQNEYDFIVISEPAFEELDLDPATKGQYHADDFWVQRGDKLGNAGDKRTKKIREAWEQARAGQEFSEDSRTDATYFNHLGVDAVIHDEFHHQKNLVSVRSRFGEQPKFLGGGGLSMRSLDFNLKARWLLDQNGGKNVYGLTATPTKNSPIEIYAMLSHVAPEALERIGIRNSEEFLDRYAKFENGMALNTSGAMEEALVTAGFRNMEELRSLMGRYIRRKTAADVGLKLPEREDVTHMIDMDAAQQAKYAELRELAAEAGGKDATGDAHIFSIMDKMNKAAADMSLLDPSYDAATSPKYVACAQQVIEGMKAGGQIVFSDYVESHEKIAEALVRSGIPRKQIGILNAKAAATASSRQRISDDFNSGKLKVVIGNTAVMGEGINLQKNTSDIHHLDLPWEPASVQQRNGRGLRQGNTQKGVRIHNYLARGSFDGYRLQSIMSKRDWQDAVWNGGDEVENLNSQTKVGRDELMIMLAADPDQAREAFAANAKAQEEKLAAGKTAEASARFMKFQEARRSFNALGNKNTASAQRLQAKLERERAILQADRYFTAKQALQGDQDVLLTDSGVIMSAGTAVDMGDKGRWVVTGVDTRSGSVMFRPYGKMLGGTRSGPVAGFSGAKAFAYDAGEEAAEIAREAASKPIEIATLSDIYKIPEAALAAPGAADKLQETLWDWARRYKLRIVGDSVPMIERATGKMQVLRSYEISGASDKVSATTHEFALPTEKNRRKAIEAWKEAERSASFGTEDTSSRRGRGRSSYYSNPPPSRVVRRYKGASLTENRNPLADAVRSLHQEPGYGYADTATLRQARKELEREQMQRIEQAPDMLTAFRAAIPLSSIDTSISKDVRMPRAAIAALWQKAAAVGAESTDTNIHRHPDDGYSSGGWLTHKGGTVLSVLARTAVANGHDDLAREMVEQAIVGGRMNAERYADTMSALADHPNESTPDRWRAVRALAQHVGISDKARTSVPSLHRPGSYMQPGKREQTVGQWIDEQMTAAMARQERKAA